jgi:hypothetical protein
VVQKGMVDALEQARRILVEGGILVDARPDSRVRARVRAKTERGRIIGTIATQRETRFDDLMSDRAVRDVLDRGLFGSLRRGRIWHAIPFEGLAELRSYLRDHLRFSHRVQWRASRPQRDGPLFVDRAIRFELLERR